MSLEFILRYLSPVPQNFDRDSVASRDFHTLRRNDILNALGFIHSQCELGLNLWFAKIGVNSPDRALEQLCKLAFSQVNRCPPLANLDKVKRQHVIKIICFFAFQDYSKSASSRRQCSPCQGEGFIESTVCKNNSQKKTGKNEACERKVTATDKLSNIQEVVKILCKSCSGKGTLNNSCKCRGRGEVLNRKQTKLLGRPVFLKCSKCKGKGYTRVKFSTVLNSIRKIWGVSTSTAYQHIRPFYDMLVSICYKEESAAEKKLKSVFE